MRLATKIIVGYATLIVLLAAVLVYQVISIHEMQSINRDLSDISFRAANTSIQVMRDRDLVEEYTQKSFLGDPDYIDRLKEFREDFQTSLEDLQRMKASTAGEKEIERLSQFWFDFTTALEREQEGIRPGVMRDLPPDLSAHLDGLRTQTQTVHQAIIRAIGEEVQDSRQTGEKAELISWVAAGIALVLSGLVSLLILRSISEPLRNLTEGTRAIAEGKFFYRLDTSRHDEFGQLAKDFNTMTRRLNELDQMKKDFVSHVSHELKAPLASMQETIQLLLDQIPGPLSDKQRRLLELNLQSGSRLSAMIGNLLDLSRMEAGVVDYELQTRNLADLVQTVIAEFEPRTREKNIQVEALLPEEPLLVECDEDRIIQVVSNLLGNAVKFSPGGAAIRVHLHAADSLPEGVPGQFLETAARDQVNGFALLSVADAGPGVPDEHKEKIFERFHQVKQGKKILGQGVGLGLAICRTIVQAHRGAIWVEDNPEKGSTFFLLLKRGIPSDSVLHRSSSPI